MALRTALLVGLSTLPLLCCGTNPTEPSDPAVPIRVTAGEEFVVVLGSNPSTGYTWRLAVPLDETIVRLVGSRYQPDESNGRPGSGGKDFWTFVAVGRGRAVIHFESARGAEPALSRLAFSVEVR
jgi:predicted secreted protein